MNNPFPEISRPTATLAKVYTKHLDLYFSYQTLVAFRHNHPNKGVVTAMCKNQWGRATGTHLNKIEQDWYPVTAERLDYAEFQKRVEELNL